MSNRFAGKPVVLLAVLFAALVTPLWARPDDDGHDDKKANSYKQRNLVSDQSGVAEHVDPNLVNAWGLYFSPASPFWVNNNGTGTATVYDGDGNSLPAGSPLVVTIPRAASASGPGNSAPTGGVFNPFMAFPVQTGKNAVFIFVTEDGTISGWNPGANATTAIITVDNSASGAVYKGVALGLSGGTPHLYAANFNSGHVDVYDGSFAKVTLAGSFTDPNLPAGYAPFDIANLGGKLYVTFALQNAAKHDDVAGPGNGFVDVFDTDGNLIRRFASGGTLNSPWGITVAPTEFGAFGNAVLVGNFGDGTINAFDAASGSFLGQLHRNNGQVISIDGLWSIAFGNGTKAGLTDVLYFTAGPGGESHGLFGSLSAKHKDKDKGKGDDDQSDQDDNH